MLQQTQVKTVIPYYHRFLDRFPSVGELADASEQEVLKLWEGLGYYSRVRNLHKAAKRVMTDHMGIIPRDPETFATLPGVGTYITAAVMSIAVGTPIAAVDGNVMRVYTRFIGIGDDIRKNSVRNRIIEELQPLIPSDSASDFTQAFMELGALICTPKVPQCNDCPFQEGCYAFTHNEINRFPYKSPSGKVPEYRVSVGIIIKNEKIYIQKRPSKGHLGGLWEFPGGKSEKEETPAQTLIRECKEELGCTVEVSEKLTEVRHAYSHFKIHMNVFICRLPDGERIEQPLGHPFKWVSSNQLEQYPFPGANHKFFPRLKVFLEQEHCVPPLKAPS